MMIDTIKSLQAVVDVPLQIDSTIPEVLEAALRVYNGKPLVNSVNGEEESLNNVLPLVKKYGAAVVGLALDKDGIPKKAEDRVAIAKKIMDRGTPLLRQFPVSVCHAGTFGKLQNLQIKRVAHD